MLLFTKGENTEIVISLNEKVVYTNPLFRFVFTNDMTGEVIDTILNDISTYKSRYNLFQITINDYFLNAKNGFWTYEVYERYPKFWEQIDTQWQTLDFNWSDNLIEVGKMKLVGTAFEFIQYEKDLNDYIIYN